MGKRQGIVGIAAAGLGVLVAQPLAGAAAVLPPHLAAPSLTVPSATVPSVSTPKVTTPSITTPTVSIPKVTTPTVTTPKVTTPTVTTPKVTTPTVTTPKVTTPTVTTPKVTTPTVTTPKVTTPTVTTPKVTTPKVSAPTVTTPKVTTPKVSSPVGTVPATHVPSVTTPATPGSVRTAASNVAAGLGTANRTSTPQGTGASSSAAPQAAAGSGSAAAGGATGSSFNPSGPITAAERTRALRAVGLGPGSPRARRLAVARENRKLRRLVARLRDCLPALDPGTRRLLDLRAGVSGPARSAKATARILHVSLRREAIRERRALEALTRSAATGCTGGPVAVAPAMSTANLPALSASPPTPAGVSAAPARPGTPSVSRASYQSNHPGGGTAHIAKSGAHTEKAEASGSFPSALVTALLGMLLALAMVVAPKLRRRPASAMAGAAASSRRARATEAPGSTAAGGPPRTQTSPSRRPITRVVAPTDPAIAPMAADAYASMAGDGEDPPPAAASGEVEDAGADAV